MSPSHHAATDVRLSFLFCTLLALTSLFGVADAAQGQAAIRFTESGKTLVCLNTLQPFGFGLSSGSTYDVHPFRNGGSDLEVMPDERLKKIRSVGFDCIRMAIDVAALAAASDDNVLDRLVDELTVGIARRVTFGLKVIADIHPLPKTVHPVSGYSDVDIIDGPTGPKFRRLIMVVSRLATAIGAKFRSADVALELFNEPPAPGDFSKRAPWNRQIEEYWSQIRHVLPNHTLIISGTSFAGIDGAVTGFSASGLLNLRPEEFDVNTSYAFHPYESALFTHQGQPGIFSHVHGLSFPAASYPGGQKRAESDFMLAVNSDSTLSPAEKTTLITNFVRIPSHSYSFSRYWREFGSPDALAARLAIVTAWADAHGLERSQIMNTEFGVNRNQPSCENLAPHEGARAFIEATRENSVKAGIGAITIHELQGSCFGISDSHAPFKFDEEILSALGLR